MAFPATFHENTLGTVAVTLRRLTMFISQITRSYSWAGVYAGILCGVLGCTTQPPVSGSRHTIPVVVTYSILGEWVQRIGGDHVTVTTLVGPNGDAHTYEPTPKDSVALSQARLIFENGLGFETWLDKLVEASSSTAQRIVVTTSIPPRTLSDTGGPDEVDPHVWHSPKNAIVMVMAVSQALSNADPAHAVEYRQRAADYIKELESLQLWVQEQVTLIPINRRRLVTTHDTFGYFANDYGFDVLNVMGSTSSEVADPSAAEIAAVIDRIREQQVPAIFAENIINPKLTEQVARESGVKLVPTLYTDALGPTGSTGATYVQMVRFNVTTIVEALR